MKSTVKKLSDTRVQLTITVDIQELAAARQVALVRLARNISVPGFRKGHVPASVAVKHVNAAALEDEALNAALSKAVADAFTKEDIMPLERPDVQVKKYVPDQELEFTAEAEILPPVKLGDYTKLKVVRPEISVDKSDIDDVIERIRSSFTDKKAVTRAAKLGDEAVIDFVGKKDDKAFDGGTGNDYPLVLGSGSFIPGFEEAVVGHKPGEIFDVPLTFPKNYQSKDLAGQKVVFTVTLQKVNEVTLPEANDELAAKAGDFTSIKDLRADIKRELLAQKQREADDTVRDDLVGQLVEKSKVPAPQLLIDDQIRSIETDMRQNLMYQGLTLEQYIQNKGFASEDEWKEKEVTSAATRRVQAGLALNEVSKQEKIFPTDEQIAARVAMYRQQYANNPDMAKRFDEPEIQRDIANRLATEMTVDRLLELNSK